ncbi:FkbM family methyltransferase [Methylocella sp.]|uniref:FkbM family methyltransferase n=1 Tax=Methylocella sp. TaxID=1978226 RepID=UPI003783C178
MTSMQSFPPPNAELAPTRRELRRLKLFDLAAERLRAFVRKRRSPLPSVSQCGQDLFVAEHIFRRKRGGFFLEIGGGDGRYLSNTLVLELYLDWRGVLVEPTQAFEALRRNRPNAACVRAALSDRRKRVRVTEVTDMGQVAMNPGVAEANTLLSVVEDADAPSAYEAPHFGSVVDSYVVEAMTLDEVLTETGAPATIDYFSFDVEGHEFEILRDFPFDKWRFNCLGVERPSEELHKLLCEKDYFLIRDDGPLDWFYLRRDFLVEWFASLD